MNCSAFWIGKEALVGIRCLTINTRSNRVASVSSIIKGYFNPVQMLDSHISTYSIKKLVIYSCFE